jgi:hypothetical protein
MFYGGYDTHLTFLATGHATSADGVHWTKDAGNPILHPKDDAHATRWVRSPAVVQTGSADWIYYDYGGEAIGVATRVLAPSAIVVEPSSLEASLYANQEATRTLWISNAGGLDLDFYLYESARGLNYDLPWLSQDPVSGTVAPGEGMAVSVFFNGAGLAPEVYQGLLGVASNDPTAPSVDVPVTLVVELEPVWWRVYLPVVVKTTGSR